MTRRLVAILLAIVLLNCPTALACGPFTLEAIFVHTVHPTYPLAQFAAGRIGVVQPSYARSYLYTAYGYLSGRNFSSSEQKAMVELWKERLEFSADSNPEYWSKAWLEARKKVAGVQERGAIDVYRNREKPNEYENYVNCNKDSFDTAAATLNERIAKYGAASPALQSWVAAQDVVFSNCASGTAIPEPLSATDDALMRADRTYQIAAANFYATNFDEARKGFEIIAADNSSPWARTAPYLIARTLVRKASIGSPEQKDESLRAAESQLTKILADKNLAQLRPQLGWIDDLLKDGRPYVWGDTMSLADCVMYHPLWVMDQLAYERIALIPNHIRQWMDCIAARGHGTFTPMTVLEAIAVAAAAEPEPPLPSEILEGDPTVGEMISVTPLDYGRDNPSIGMLISIDARRVALQHNNERTGPATVHFPRFGYNVRPVST